MTTAYRSLPIPRDAVHETLRDVLKPEALRRPIVFGDTETTGLFPSKDRIIEIGAIKFSATGEFMGVWHHYFDPGISIPDEAAKVHGITNSIMKEMVADGRAAPMTSRTFNDLNGFIGDATFIAHNATFDVKFLEAEARKVGKEFQPGHIIDTLPLARVRFPRRKLNLDQLCKLLSVKVSGREEFHGAMVDAVILADMFAALIKPDDHLNMFDLLASPPAPEENVAHPVSHGAGTSTIRMLGEPTREESRRHEQFILSKIRKAA